MASLLSVLKTVIKLNSIHVNSYEIVQTAIHKYGEVYDQDQIFVHARPYRSKQRKCPVCGRKCPGYDYKHKDESRWRAPDLNGVPVYICYRPERIRCPEHDVQTEALPWADGTTRSTPEFNDEIAWLVTRMSKSAIADYKGINWRTVGNCVKASMDRHEPDVSARIHCGVRRICVDETSYRKGYEYITVVYDMDRNRVIWVHKDHGKGVFEEFCKLMTEEERMQVEVVAGDGAQWIDSCTKEYFPNAKRCTDFFHVVQWANEALDKVRSATARKAAREYDKMKAEFLQAEEAESAARKEVVDSLGKARAELDTLPRRGRPGARKRELLEYISRLEDELSPDGKAGKKPGRPRKVQLAPEHQEILDGLMDAVKAIKGAKHALGHDPRKCTQSQSEKIRLIENSYPDLYRAYQMKESLRLILHMTDPALAKAELEKWIDEAAASGLAPMKALSEKIGRHSENILNAIEMRANSAKCEATNTTIKVLIKMARGFWNLENLISLVYLKCSDIVIPLHNRPQMPPERAKWLRERSNERRRRSRQPDGCPA